MFAEDMGAGQIARSLRVSTNSVYQWWRAWRAGGDAGLASKGPGGNASKLDEGQLRVHSVMTSWAPRQPR